MCKIDINYVSLLVISVFTPLDALENETITEQTVEDVHYRKDFPYQVSLHYSHNDEFICGGTIISSTVVLTAAHCMYYKWGGLLPPIIVTVSAGKTNLNETAWRNFDVDSITLHPLFNKTSMEYDLAVIEVNDQFPTSDVIGSVTVEKAIPEAQYNECFVTGWPQQSLNLELTEVVITTCYNYPERICTVKRNENETTCINEAGVPLICDRETGGHFIHRARLQRSRSTNPFRKC
ncbi:hypothetical protein NQ317_014097 [Molorchus minor]|uniref:Peptidase S1 domain-containing protein n=1 Tax=Molorchus minor TaxID=1323400 RepID=A0ABQ9JCY9_9CUCU|nr:hypothetical protein NQ317_014097 [Molorchus minor]